MGSTKSEEVAKAAFRKYRDGNLRDCILQLVDYADRKVNNHRTEYIFKLAIDSELATVEPSVSQPHEDARNCVHCGSFSTYFRATDGDIACNNCDGIMPQDNGGDN